MNATYPHLAANFYIVRAGLGRARALRGVSNDVIRARYDWLTATQQLINVRWMTSFDPPLWGAGSLGSEPRKTLNTLNEYTLKIQKKIW